MRRSCTILLLINACAMAACTTTPQEPPKQPMSPEAIKRLNEIAEYEMMRGDNPSLRFNANLQDLCEVPYDRTTLPLLSPDGRFIATVIGPSPTTPTRLAEPGAPAPLDTSIEVWRIGENPTGCSVAYRLDPPLLLGRSADSAGFLVESPRPDGSRWIGKVAWDSGDIDWLVEDDMVNAFASLGRSGELAWCAREREARAFSLVIREKDGREIVIDPQGGNWLFPSWSTLSERIYVFWLSRSGTMKLATMSTLSSDIMMTSLQDVDIMANGSVELVEQAAAAHPVVQGPPAGNIEGHIFYHPVKSRVAVWVPEDSTDARPFVLLKRSVAAAPDVEGGGRYLVATPYELRYVNPSRMHSSIRIHDELAIPRATSNGDRQYILMSPVQDTIMLRALNPRINTSASPGS